MKRLFPLLIVTLLLSCAVLSRKAQAESQTPEYKGMADPFGDPTTYEFSEDEKEDKEFFHLGRYIMFGVDLGAGIYTGGLGSTNSAAFYVGGRLVYFFDKALALEAGVHYGNSLDSIHPSAQRSLELDTNLIPINLGMRYYFNTQNAPKAIAVANPYLAGGGGLYLRSQNVISSSGINFTQASGSSFGAYGGGGVEFAIYGRHIFLGLDARYHMVFFPDKDSTLGGLVAQGSRSGDYFTTYFTLTYCF